MTEDKKNWRRDDLATRIVLRIPNEVYDRVVGIATALGEKINPKSGQVRLTATLNKLIEVGIIHLSDTNLTKSVNNLINHPIDVGLSDRIKELEDKYRELSDNIKQDNNPIDIRLIENEVHRALMSLDVPSRGEFDTIAKCCLEQVDSRITSALTPLQDEISEVAEFSHNLQGEIVKIKKPLAIG